MTTTSISAPWASPERVLCVPSKLTAAIHQWAADEKPAINHGPSFVDSSYQLYGDRGSVGPHEDGADLTMGLVLVADGPRHLKVGDRQWPLYPGSVFLIDSNKTHAAPCGWADGLLVFLCVDFLSSGKLPNPTKFAFDGLFAAARIFDVDLTP